MNPLPSASGGANTGPDASRDTDPNASPDAGANVTPDAGANRDKQALRRHYRQLRRQSLPRAAAGLLEVMARELPLALEAADARARAAHSKAGEAGEARAAREAREAREAIDAGQAGDAGDAGEPCEAGETSETGEAREAREVGEAGEAGEAGEPSNAAPSRLGLYWPVGHEPDWRPLLQRWPESLTRRLALPVVRPFAGVLRLTYAAWHPDDPLVADACGIPAPASGEPLPAAALALLLVPALALDRRGIRLGSGGGWYDRLRSDPSWGQVPAWAVLPAACLAEALPMDPWDVPFAGWLDETGRQAKVSGFD